MLQFRSILRISNVSISEFLDSIIFKDKKDLTTLSDFKVKTEAILKNHTSDFANFIFKNTATMSRDQLQTALNKVYFEFKDYLDEQLEAELEKCKDTIRDAFEIEDTKGLGILHYSLAYSIGIRHKMVYIILLSI